MQKIGCALIKDLRGTCQSHPTGFTRRDPAPASHLTLIKLAELLKDLSRPENRADSDEVGSDLKIILASERGLVTRNSFSHSRLSRRRQVGSGKFSPLMAFDKAFGEWEARTGDCRPPTLVPPGQGLTVNAADAHAIKEMALQGAWNGLRQRKRDKPDPLSSWHWHMGTQCIIGTYATFISPEDQRDVVRAVLDSQAALLNWTMDFPRDETDREIGSGLEFECQLNTPSLARLHQLKELCRTNIMTLRRTLLDNLDLLRMDAGDFVEEGYHTIRGGWWVRARAEECPRPCIQCGRAWSARQVDPQGWCAPFRKDKPENASRNDIATARHIGLLVCSALPEELDSMEAGRDVKETFFTVPIW